VEVKMLDRMRPLDAGFLDIEDEDSHAAMPIAAVAVLEGPVPTQEELLTAMKERGCRWFPGTPEATVGAPLPRSPRLGGRPELRPDRPAPLLRHL